MFILYSVMLWMTASKALHTLNLGTSEIGHTPLLIASSEGHADIVEMLLRKGADVNG